MFCPNCGSEVKDDDLFCGECGAKIEHTEVPESEPVKKEAAPQSESVRTAAGFSDKAKKIIIAEIAVLVVLIAAFFYLGNKKSSPESAANQFVKDYNSQRWSKIYDLYNFEEDTFINQEAYEQTMEQSETKTLSGIWNLCRTVHLPDEKRFRHDNDPCSKISKEEFLIL